MTSIKEATAEQHPDFKICGLCEKQIEISKFRLHDTMCSRMNYKCKECGMVVLKAEKQQHDEEVCGKPVKTESREEEIIQPKAPQVPQTEEMSSLIEEMKDDEPPYIPPEMPDFSKMTQAEIEEANEKEIQRIMEEQANQMLIEEMQQKDSNLPMTNYERSKLETAEKRAMYGEDASLWPEGVRPADENKIQSLYDDPMQNYDDSHQDYEGNVFNQADENARIGQFGGFGVGMMGGMNQNFGGFPMMGPQQMSHSRSQEELKGPQAYDEPLGQMEGDNNMDQMNFQGKSEQELLEEQMLQEIMEQSKNDQ